LEQGKDDRVKGKLETENILFAVLIFIFVVVTAVMGGVLYGKKPHPPEKTLTILIASDPAAIKEQEIYSVEYRKLYPEMKIETIQFPYRNIWQKLEYMIVAGIPPDVSGIEQPNFPKFIQLGAVEPLDDWIKNDPEMDISALFPQCLSEANWDNIQYGLPTNWSTVCLFYNKDLFDEAGLDYPNRDWTREDLVAAGKALTKDLDGDGTIDQWGFFTNNNHWHRYSAWVWMTGGDFFTPDLRRSLFDDPKVIDGFQWLADLPLKYRIMPTPDDLSGTSTSNIFLAGQLAMLADTRFFVRKFKLESYADKIKTFDWDISELPHDKARATVFVCSINMIPSSLPDERKQLAWNYLKFITGKTGQQVIADSNGALPARMDVAEEMMKLAKDRKPHNDRAFIRSIEYARYPYRPFPAEDAWTNSRSYLQGVWSGTRDVAEICKRNALDINRTMERYERLHPDAKLPLNTKWVPYEERTETAPAAVEGVD
jgi:multiple sugar transport system substrate-binding protein